MGSYIGPGSGGNVGLGIGVSVGGSVAVGVDVGLGVNDGRAVLVADVSDRSAPARAQATSNIILTIKTRTNCFLMIHFLKILMLFP
jgi:hypothetical protein